MPAKQNPPKQEREYSTPHKYTAAEIRFLERKIPGRSAAETTVLFNARFGLEMSEKQIRCFMANHKLRNGRDTRFQPGIVPHNKGKKGYCAPGSEAGWFRPGHRPGNWRPAGSERINAGGYVEVKTAGPGVWKMKHVMRWERAHGPVPKGHVIIFADGNRLNIRLGNLLMVSRSELAVMNRLGLISPHRKLTEIGKSIADIKLRIAGRKKELKKRKKPRGGPRAKRRA